MQTQGSQHLSGKRVEELLAQAGFTKSGFGKRIGLDEKQIRRVINGEGRLPEAAAAWLQRWADFARANPAPNVARRRGRPPGRRAAAED
jgi:hypothetical protein